MQHSKDQWALVFSDEVEHVVMRDARDKEFRPVFEENPRSGLLATDRPEVLFQKSFVKTGLFDSPS